MNSIIPHVVSAAPYVVAFGIIFALVRDKWRAGWGL